jgi:hypothetical protein
LKVIVIVAFNSTQRWVSLVSKKPPFLQLAKTTRDGSGDKKQNAWCSNTI